MMQGMDDSVNGDIFDNGVDQTIYDDEYDMLEELEGSNFEYIKFPQDHISDKRDNGCIYIYNYVVLFIFVSTEIIGRRYNQIILMILT